MASDRKILITGLTGQIGHPVARFLALDNEVWGVARYSADGSRERAESIGVHTHVADLETGDYGDLPTDFTHLVHFAAWQGPAPDFDRAMRANAEATGLLMAHCRHAEAALIASTNTVYRPNEDPWHAYLETDPLGNPTAPHSPTYAISKIAQEAVARTMARALDLPTTIARINASYGPNGGLPAYHCDAIAAGKAVPLRLPEQSPYSPIHEDDLAGQVAPLLDAAASPATIVNWCGDEIVTAEQWCALFGQRLGLEPDLSYYDLPGSQPGSAADPTRRRSLTGPCTVGWQDAMAAMLDQRTGPADC
ncbi:MAG: NAD(P)-dependent oxidoreductase [Acidimicrobiales bacterium]|nr:NAD(P)-dependent oxidoreductase [Acidimicrobiales bacterium]